MLKYQLKYVGSLYNNNMHYVWAEMCTANAPPNPIPPGPPCGKTYIRPCKIPSSINDQIKCFFYNRYGSASPFLFYDLFLYKGIPGPPYLWKRRRCTPICGSNLSELIASTLFESVEQFYLSMPAIKCRYMFIALS